MEDTHSIDALLEHAVALGASDLHITAGSPPALRVRGELSPLRGLPPLDDETIRELLYRILTTEQQKRLELDRQIDLSYGVPGLARFRINVFLQRDSLCGRVPRHPGRAEDARGARPARGPHDVLDAPARPRPRHRPDRLG